MGFTKHTIEINVIIGRDDELTKDIIKSEINKGNFTTHNRKACCENMDLEYVDLIFEPGDGGAWFCKHCDTNGDRIE